MKLLPKQKTPLELLLEMIHEGARRSPATTITLAEAKVLVDEIHRTHMLLAKFERLSQLLVEAQPLVTELAREAR